MAARVLLIEDDAAIARFVELALQELPGFDPAAPAVELAVRGNLAAARAALAQGHWQLVISDLMLPDGSAETLLADGLAQVPGAPPWVIFSAGLHDDRREALTAHGVARLLRKPVSLAELLGTVGGLLKGDAAAGPRAFEPEVEDAAAGHFGGDRALFDTFRASCIERFADDIAQGDAAVAAGDARALTRIAHDLKAVLALIGQPDLAERARALEAAAAAMPAGGPLPPGWPPLALGLRALR